MFLGPGELVTGFNTSCSTVQHLVSCCLTSDDFSLGDEYRECHSTPHSGPGLGCLIGDVALKHLIPFVPKPLPSRIIPKSFFPGSVGAGSSPVQGGNFRATELGCGRRACLGCLLSAHRVIHSSPYRLQS